MDRYKNCIGYVEGIVPSSSNKIPFSILTLFGESPVHPDKFNKLDPRLKWFGICKDSDTFCVGCGTLTPQIPYSHHSECGHYLSEEYCKELDDYKKECMGAEKQRSEALKVEIKNGKLIISIGIDTLSHVCTYSDYWDNNVSVTDTYLFAQDIVSEIVNNDEGEGTVYYMLDTAASKAVENGSIGVEVREGD
ncbi:hypothetical protein VPHG_00191 [Vibrio phage 11895-B1]|uniref:hypothetical protein n=1 Tax=Vibrio phage 11895-B1 TaxID=754075 RepID=UPI0002C0A41D|nr:hypothetical protein VPHG_00191 [Vibrio phage 11895-B1]AGH32254.1 hypothetical protein VPHG_00191 [Vibrio phage 11895-B1]